VISRVQRSPFAYAILSWRIEQVWVPLGLWGVFILITCLRGLAYGSEMAQVYLGWVIPLLGGVLSAYAVLEDPVLELHFASPRPGWRLLLERLGLVLGLQSMCALTYQLFLWVWGLDLSYLGNILLAQLSWLVPCLATGALGCLFALLFRQGTVGAMLMGLIWIFQAAARGWFASEPVASLFYIAMGYHLPDSPSLWFNRLTLFGLASLCFVFSRILFQKQERNI